MNQVLRDAEILVKSMNARQFVFIFVSAAFIALPLLMGVIYYFINTDQAALFFIFGFTQFSGMVVFAWTGVPFRLPGRLGGLNGDSN